MGNPIVTPGQDINIPVGAGATLTINADRGTARLKTSSTDTSVDLRNIQNSSFTLGAGPLSVTISANGGGSLSYTTPVGVKGEIGIDSSGKVNKASIDAGWSLSVGTIGAKITVEKNSLGQWLGTGSYGLNANGKLKSVLEKVRANDWVQDNLNKTWTFNASEVGPCDVLGVGLAKNACDAVMNGQSKLEGAFEDQAQNSIDSLAERFGLTASSNIVDGIRTVDNSIFAITETGGVYFSDAFGNGQFFTPTNDSEGATVTAFSSSSLDVFTIGDSPSTGYDLSGATLNPLSDAQSLFLTAAPDEVRFSTEYQKLEVSGNTGGNLNVTEHYNGNQIKVQDMNGTMTGVSTWHMNALQRMIYNNAERFTGWVDDGVGEYPGNIDPTANGFWDDFQDEYSAPEGHNASVYINGVLYFSELFGQGRVTAPPNPPNPFRWDLPPNAHVQLFVNGYSYLDEWVNLAHPDYLWALADFQEHVYANSFWLNRNADVTFEASGQSQLEASAVLHSEERTTARATSSDDASTLTQAHSLVSAMSNSMISCGPSSLSAQQFQFMNRPDIYSPTY